MADFIVSAAPYGARFEQASPLEFQTFFRPSMFHTKEPGEGEETYYIYRVSDPITVGTVGTGWTESNPVWTFRASGVSPGSVVPRALNAFLNQEFLAAAAENPFFSLNGTPLSWFSKNYSRFTNDFKIAMPTPAAVLSQTLREIITGFTVDASGAAPVVTSVTKGGSASVSLSIYKIGSGEFIPGVSPDIIAAADADVYGVVTFSSLYNSGFYYSESTGAVVENLRTFKRKFSFAAMAEPPSF